MATTTPQNIKELYKELCTFVTSNVPAIKWADLWHNQVNFLETEHQFPTPAIFFSFRLLSVEDAGAKGQKVRMQVDTYIFYETLADTYHGSWNQDTALDFLDLIVDTHNVLHGSEGQSYSSMRRIGFGSVDTGSAGNLYLQSFTCELMDFGASKEWSDQQVNDIDIQPGSSPAAPEPDNSFIV